MSPSMGPVRMRSKRRDKKPSEAKRNAWELWKALPRIKPYLAPYRRTLVWIVLLTFAAAMMGLAEPWPLAVILNNVLHDNNPSGFVKWLYGPNPTIWVVLVSMLLLRFMTVVIGNLFTVANHYLGARTEQNMILDLRSDLFRHVQRLSLTFHDHKQTGALMSQINLQAAAVGNIVMVIPPIMEATVTLGGMLVIASLVDWELALMSLVVVPLLYWSFGVYGRRIVPRIQEVQRLEWRSLSIVHEAMSMLRVIVSFGREDYEHQKFREQGQAAVDERVKLTVSQSLYTLGVQTATAAGGSLVLGFGAWHVMQGKLSIGELIVLLTYIVSVYQPLEQVSGTIGTVHEQLVQFNASLNILDTEPEVKEKPEAVDIGRAKGWVGAEGVSFNYSTRKETLSDISFVAQPGERVAIVGHTGAGKSTLMSLLIRFYDPKQGSIAIDGVDLRDLRLDSLRNQISVVLQDPLLFSGTIAENIRYGKLDANDEEVWAAARAANAHDFIEGLPDGYETILGERGAQISGGERQRISVARAFLKDAPILILDEPTSSIDSKTEAVILDALDDLMEGRTSFMIAHRLSTVRHADQILVLDRGRIVERGTHDQLVAADGTYHQLYLAQTKERKRRGTRSDSSGGNGGNGNVNGGNGKANGVHGNGGTPTPVRETISWRQVGEGS